ncbi:MAG: hypothetical protein ABSA78_13760 [Candidatus Sulfotelmatobacter sp.]
MGTGNVERAGVGFTVGRQSGTTVVEVHTHHNVISTLRGVQIGFELLNGITAQQAKKIVDLLNENVIGVFVTTSSEGQAAAGR